MLLGNQSLLCTMANGSRHRYDAMYNGVTAADKTYK